MSQGDLLAELLYQAVALHGRQREEFVADVEQNDPPLGAELRSLLAYAEEDGERFVGAPVLAPPPERASAPVHDEAHGERLGPYTLTSLIGRGGMGQVYRAIQHEPIHRAVAIKRIKPGMDSDAVLRRFRNERRTLARLQHPNIAKALDAGVDTQGRPFIVMELIDGPPITEYCRLHATPQRDQIQLFRQACLGVAYAHSCGLLHRDLKPANLLVVESGGEPTAKVIDFGMAALFEHGAEGVDTFEASTHGTSPAPVGTIDYMSPEQLAGEELDERTDVYALGLTLYVMLADTLPFDTAAMRALDPARRARSLRAAVTRSPSAASGPDGQPRTAARELDWICLQAIEPDRARRYPTVRALVDELDRFLSGDAVRAAPPSRRYRLRKAIARHRVAFGVTAAALLTLVAVNAAIVVSYVRIRASQRATAAALGDFEASAEFLSSVISSTTPYELGPDTTLRAMLDRALRRFDRELAPVERVRARLRPVFGSSLTSLEEFDRAEEQYRAAEGEIARSFGTGSAEMAHLQIRWAALEDRRHRTDAMRERAERAGEILDRLTAPHPELRARALVFAGLARSRLGDDVEGGLARLREAFAYMRAHGLLASRFGVRAGVWLAGAQRWAGQHDEAERLLGELLQVAAASPEQGTWEWQARIDTELGALRINDRRPKDALAPLERAIATYTKNMGEDAPQTLGTRASRCIALALTGDQDEAIPEMVDVIARFTALGSHTTSRVLSLRANLLGLRMRRGEYSAVLTEVVPLVEDLGEVRGPDTLQTAQAHAIHGKALLELDRPAAAIAPFQRAATIYEQSGGTRMRIYASLARDLARALKRCGRDAEAAEYERRAEGGG